tara:strand:+ start:210 stop:344 length:135 start_codon:yes stop_codon:yes gene_type:complete
MFLLPWRAQEDHPRRMVLDDQQKGIEGEKELGQVEKRRNTVYVK